MKIKVNFSWELNEDQAILAEVVKRCEELGHKPGRTALQKIAYFLKRQGVPMSYGFELYHYGPFCQEILWDAEMLTSLGVIVDTKRTNGGSRYGVGESYSTEIAKHSAFLTSNSDEIDAVVKLLAPLPADTLEVVATLDYFFRYVSARGGNGPFKADVMAKFFEAKSQYVGRELWVGKLYDRMAAIGMVGA